MTGFGSAGIDRFCHLMLRQQTWQESQNSNSSSLVCRCGNRFSDFQAWRIAPSVIMQAIRLPLFVPLPTADDRLLLSTESPRPYAPSCWPERLLLLEFAYAPPIAPAKR
jgi:hypothetical protein